MSRSILGLLMTGFCLMSAVATCADDLVLADGGQSAYRIVVADDASPSTRHARRGTADVPAADERRQAADRLRPRTAGAAGDRAGRQRPPAAARRADRLPGAGPRGLRAPHRRPARWSSPAERCAAICTASTDCWKTTSAAAGSPRT